MLLVFGLLLLCVTFVARSGSFWSFMVLDLSHLPVVKNWHWECKMLFVARFGFGGLFPFAVRYFSLFLK